MNLAELLLSLIERTGFADDAEKALHAEAAKAVHGLEQRLAQVEQHIFGHAQAPAASPASSEPASSEPAVSAGGAPGAEQQ